MLHRVQVTDTSQHQLFRGDFVNQAFMVELLQKKQLKEHQSEEETCFGQETRAMDIRPVEICPLV